MSPRISPLPPAEWTEAAREVFSIIEGPKARENGTRFKIILTLANYPDLAIPYLNFSKCLLKTSSLSDRIREIVTLRVAHLYRSEYEWDQHVISAIRIGMTEAEIAAVKVGAAAIGWSDLERQLLRAVDELRADSTITDETWNALAAHLDQRQLMDLLFTVGGYAMLAMFLNAAGVELEDS
ncbi:MAG: carboxymuconolactone decarboxylase family protein [Rhodospirillaceae bacterium]|nr:MAG: carboxymuconolactone decarboxylase family protein [Rhodospirillaceae bacterium]